MMTKTSLKLNTPLLSKSNATVGGQFSSTLVSQSLSFVSRQISVLPAPIVGSWSLQSPCSWQIKSLSLSVQTVQPSSIAALQLLSLASPQTSCLLELTAGSVSMQSPASLQTPSLSASVQITQFSST